MRTRSRELRLLSIYFPFLREDLKKRGTLDREKEKNVLIHLAQWAYRFSPIVSPDMCPADCESHLPHFAGINLDITGCERLFQGEETLLKKISDSLQRFQLRHRIAIAPSLGSAWALSRYGDSPLVRVDRPGLLKSIISPLPVAALRLPARTLLSLEELHISSIDELMKLPRKSLLERYGKGIIDRLDQAFGHQQEPIHPIRILTLARVEKRFDGSVLDTEILKLAGSELLATLLENLKEKHRQPTQIIAQLQTTPGEILSKELSLAAPTLNLKHLARFLEKKLETIRAPFGIERMTLIANRTEQFTPAAGQFLALRSTNPEGERSLGELLDTLIQNLGRERLFVPEAQTSHLPEKILSLKPFDPQDHSTKASPLLPQTDRPSLLLNKPQPIRAMATLPDGPPFWLKWRETRYEIAKALGPERISTEWWSGEGSSSRDYFKVQIPNGTWLWIFRELESSRWFLQGLWA